MHREDVLKTVYSIFEQVASIPPGQLGEDTAFADLDMDSVDFMKIMLGVEEAFGFEFRNEDLNLEGYGNFGRFADFLLQHYLGGAQGDTPLEKSRRRDGDAPREGPECGARGSQPDGFQTGEHDPATPDGCRDACGAYEAENAGAAAAKDRLGRDELSWPRQNPVPCAAGDAITEESRPLSDAQPVRDGCAPRPAANGSEEAGASSAMEGRTPYDPN